MNLTAILWQYETQIVLFSASLKVRLESGVSADEK